MALVKYIIVLADAYASTNRKVLQFSTNNNEIMSEVMKIVWYKYGKIIDFVLIV